VTAVSTEAPARRALPRLFGRSVASNYASSVVSLLLALFVTPVLVRGLGKDAYGTWSLVTSSVLYYSLLQFGLARAAVKFIAESKAAGDLASARRTVSTSFLSLSPAALLLIAASPGIAFLFPVLFHVPEGQRTAAMILVVLSTIDFAAGIPSDTFGAALVGLQRFDLLSATATGTAVAQVISWVVIIALGGGLVPIGIATITFSLASNVVRYALVRRLLHGAPIRRSTFDRGLIKPLVSMSGWIALGDLVELVTLRLDPVVVAFVAGVPAVGVYAVGQKLSAFVERFTGPALSMFFPHASELSATDDAGEIRATFLAGTRLALALTAPLALVISVLAAPTIHVWVGSGFGDAAAVATFFSLTSLVIAFPRVGIYILRGLGNVRFAAQIGVAEAAVNLVASILLGRAMGIAGVALGTLIGVVCNHLFVLLPYVCKRLGVPLWRLLLEIGRAHLPPAVLALVLGLELRGFAYDGIVQLMLAAIAVGATYLGVFAVTGVTPGERRRVRRVVARAVPALGAGG
jgi:O-antigen/teichoic acid export membrane protein